MINLKNILKKTSNKKTKKKKVLKKKTKTRRVTKKDPRLSNRRVFFDEYSLAIKNYATPLPYLNSPTRKKTKRKAKYVPSPQIDFIN